MIAKITAESSESDPSPFVKTASDMSDPWLVAQSLISRKECDMGLYGGLSDAVFDYKSGEWWEAYHADGSRPEAISDSEIEMRVASQIMIEIDAFREGGEIPAQLTSIFVREVVWCAKCLQHTDGEPDQWLIYHARESDLQVQ
jgi:hypothetical protein